MNTTSIVKQLTGTALSGVLVLAGLGLASGTAQADNDIRIGNRSQFVTSSTTTTSPPVTTTKLSQFAGQGSATTPGFPTNYAQYGSSGKN
jgi:hypothetical protein